MGKQLTTPTLHSPGTSIITFGDQDTQSLAAPHDDALVIALVIGGFQVQRALVDNGAAANILFWETLASMGLGQDSLTDEGLPLVGFEGNVYRAAGTINLPVIAKPHCTITHFHVLSGSSPYNAIMDRPWIHKIRAVPSTYHQCLRYPTPEGIMEIKGNQWTSRGCLISHLQNIKKKKIVQHSLHQVEPS